MDPILYFATFVSVLTFFASVVAVAGWIAWKAARASVRACRNAVNPPEAPAPKQPEFEGWHPAHLKRAGQ
jgi:hypothetical protein